MSPPPLYSFFFFFNDTATTEIYTLSLHDALPICLTVWVSIRLGYTRSHVSPKVCARSQRSEEHTSELQSRPHLVCRLLLEKKKMYISAGSEFTNAICSTA